MALAIFAGRSALAQPTRDTQPAGDIQPAGDPRTTREAEPAAGTEGAATASGEAAPGVGQTAGGVEPAPSKGEAPAPPRRQAKADDALLAQSEIGPDGRTLGPYQRSAREQQEDPVRRRPASRRPDGFWHDGFFLRLGAGLGWARDRLDTGTAGYAFAKHGGRTGRANGVAFASEVAIGGGLGRGISVGVGSYTVVAPASTAPTTDSGRYEFAVSQLALLGPFTVVYPNPARGLFFQGALGVSTFVMGFGRPDAGLRPAQAHTAVGLGAMLGAGRDWFLGREWSAGIEGRLVWGLTRGNDTEGTSWAHNSFGLNVLGVFTRN